ncbi:hypothetical protein JCM10207_000374 [Rhodosporidiobolus poonsookiae]
MEATGTKLVVFSLPSSHLLHDPSRSVSYEESECDDAKEASPLKAHENDYPAFEVPQFTIKEILGAIPSHCFERSALRSSTYVVADFAMIAALGYAASFIDPAFSFEGGSVLSGWEGFAAKWALWSVYWVAQGFVATGVWVIGGHHAFSTSRSLDDVVGLFLHSFVLVPYHPWRVSHAKHHAGIGHVSQDEVWVPRTASELGITKMGTGKKREVEKGIVLDELLEDAPLYRLYWIVVQQLVGWPMYLFTNAGSQAWYPKWTNHFSPSSLIFDARHRNQVLVSDAFLVGMLSLIAAFGYYCGGVSAVVKYYVVPYLFVNHWLVMITYLQHTDPSLPHYSAESWNFQRGALCTMDRKFLGPVGALFLHGIAETHVAHHLASRIPHYHAWEATNALKALLGPHYNSTDENAFVSLWRTYRRCRYVDDEGDVLFYNDAYGRKYRKAAPSRERSDSGVEVD